MLTKFINVKIGDIMLDPFNPRFTKPYIEIQSNILNKLLKEKQTQDILESLTRNIWWTNTIVVRKTDSLPAVIRVLIPEIYKYKYIVVEGNSRLAALKSGKVRPRGIEYNINTIIPVSEVIKEDGESQDNYETQIKILQAIHNVLMAKKWNIVSMAKHLYEAYLNEKQLYPKFTSYQIMSDISKKTAMPYSKVKEYITRYAFFNEINQLCCELKEEDWGYLEAFTTSDSVKSIFGMYKDTIDFEWNINKDFNDFEKQNMLILIPEIIKSGKLYFSDSKKFRNFFKRFSEYYKDNINDLKGIFVSVIDENQGINWMTIKENITPMFNEEKWEKELNSIFQKVNKFDANKDFAINLKGELLNIKNKLDEHIYIINNKERRG